MNVIYGVQKGKEVKSSPKKSLSPRFKSNRTKRFKLYVFRFWVDGTLSDARPCAECCRWFMVARRIGIHYDVYHTNEDGDVVKYDYRTGQYNPEFTYY
jgi:hypothetical protein